jgi:hypothetical protein
MFRTPSLIFFFVTCTATLRAQTALQGLAPGDLIPSFSLPDQNGSSRTFEDVRGPQGALIVFYRSADW